MARRTWLPRLVRTGILLTGLIAAGAQWVSAQNPDAAHRFEIGGTAGLALIAVAGARTLSFCNFPMSSQQKAAFGLRGGYQLTRRLAVEGTFERVLEDFGLPPATYVCAGLYPRFPRLGPDTLIADFPPAFRSTTVTTARAEFIPWSTSWAEGRLYAGVGRLWRLHAFSAVGGLVGRVHFGRLSLLTEVEADRYAVPFTHSERFYQDTALISTLETTTPKRSRIDATFRIGITARL